MYTCAKRSLAPWGQATELRSRITHAVLRIEVARYSRAVAVIMPPDDALEEALGSPRHGAARTRRGVRAPTEDSAALVVGLSRVRALHQHKVFVPSFGPGVRHEWKLSPGTLGVESPGSPFFFRSGVVNGSQAEGRRERDSALLLVRLLLHAAMPVSPYGKCAARYCDEDFEEEGELVAHQRLMHFRCTVASCHKMLATTKTLAEHMLNVHRRELEEYAHQQLRPAAGHTDGWCIGRVPNAKEGRRSAINLYICGMEGALCCRNHRDGICRTVAHAGVPSDALRARLERKTAGKTQRALHGYHCWQPMPVSHSELARTIGLYITVATLAGGVFFAGLSAGSANAPSPGAYLACL